MNDSCSGPSRPVFKVRAQKCFLNEDGSPKKLTKEEWRVTGYSIDLLKVTSIGQIYFATLFVMKFFARKRLGEVGGGPKIPEVNGGGGGS